ncbi:MAG: EamA/RhaT family transporter [Neisseria sp.]|nr:EamA/RhaT family transporter [Neisseria sp.]
MGYLLFSVCCSVAVSVLLKLARRYGADIGQAVAVNYAAASLLTVWLLKPDLSAWRDYAAGWPLFAALGVLLPSVFVVMGRAVDAAGIVRSDAAQRLSLFLTVAASFVLFGEQLKHGGQAAGLVLAFAALFCLSARQGEGGGQDTRRSALLLAGVWAGYGLIDILFKQLSKSGTALPGRLLVAFVLAGVLMSGLMVWKKTRWTREGVLGGLLLGCLNFGNIWSYLMAHKAMQDNPTLVFAGMNIGVIAGGTLAGALVFREKMSALNVFGIAVAVCAIVCLFYWNELAAWSGW